MGISNSDLFTLGIIAIYCSLLLVAFYERGLSKMQGIVVTHFEKGLWLNSFMLECVTILFYSSYTPDVKVLDHSSLLQILTFNLIFKPNR